MTFRSAGAGVRGTGTSAAIPVPAGVAANDIVVIQLYVQSADAIASFNFAALGFTVKTDTGTLNAVARGRLITAWKRLTGADAGTYTVTWTTSALYTGFAEAHLGINQGIDPWDAVASIIGGSTTTVSFAHTLTTSKLGDLIVVATSHATNGGDFTPAPSGMTESYDSFASFGVGNMGAYYQDAVAPGAQSKTTTTTGTTGSTYVRGFIGLLKDATVPEEPIDVRGYAELTTGDVSWNYPDTSDPRTSQEIRLNGGTPITLGAADSTYHITGLTNETVYEVEIRGINSFGAGPWSFIKRIITGSSVGGVNRLYFTAVQTWTPPAGVTSVKRLIVGGGGAGCGPVPGVSNAGGGGGAGGVDEDLADPVTPGVPIDVIGGHGGFGVTAIAPQKGVNGELSRFGSTICDGGGGGGCGSTSYIADGVDGGSGGGGGGTGGGGTSTFPGDPTGNGLGNVGGAGFNTTTNANTRSGGGGGGAASAGTAGGGANGGEGGDGYLYDTAVFGTLIGVSGRVAAGGGGGRNNTTGGTVGIGGAGGGGNGLFIGQTGGNATDLTGSGSGGGGDNLASRHYRRASDGFVVLVWEDPEEETTQKSYWGILVA